ncbi:iron-sulfur cluster assembly scaffold protein [Gilliamella sp. B2776]|uniref:iron-sulfur cluster assembly scaffold protein n=1 Tax=unclassified Gilliamella TaxID=2685620 RepID=UPI00226A09BC|nr:MULTISPECIES: iron-sulfur cluster assembly scaffold protein [unclassified Gilliamella]MCX8648998.1 iron-sulfur cluster assembly scaffold protein [Gilliamella sp. B2779]MCX8653126.1 iron-sulfur cluster assembly scaffold protein [Gilliamella sp. B2737]MCX8655386.1 iron-sulfur cluster assembly scaffold protein [Gilliamella sp. B2894]MCX8664151.1 iron-sulfur cluster assembly scaffold protein [Gilliamella sp. B2887]MCX8690810.1 iron-sulfur cluster assembly scaffold protein [Gilliamella sp. B2776
MFNKIITDNFCDPKYQGKMTESGIKLALSNPVCGDKVDIFINYNKEEDKIEKARFQAWGCTTSLAMSNIFCKYVENNPLSQVRKISDSEIGELLGVLEPSQQHCVEMLISLFKQIKEKV